MRRIEIQIGDQFHTICHFFQSVLGPDWGGIMVGHRIARFLCKNNRAAHLFSVQVGRDKSERAVVILSRKSAALESAKRHEGFYLLQSKVKD